MIDAQALTQELRRLTLRLEDDVRRHAEETEELAASLRQRHARARSAARTGQPYEVWRDEQVTLAAVAWVLGCVFVRFCEDNGLIAEPRISGPGERLSMAADTTTHHFRKRPGDSDREYLLATFAEATRLPGMGDLLDVRHNPLHELPLSVDGAAELLRFWRGTDPHTGALRHDFTDPERDTRFLGDLYQDLSEAARKRYALLQTPEFIEEFILERTLEPAVKEFGLEEATLIDPACGSGHFLLGAFRRLLDHWRAERPGTGVRVLCQEVLDRIAAVDVNPYAVAIARFRLLVAALNACGIERLGDAPDFKLQVATGDSLLHGHRPADRLPGAEGSWARPEHQHFYDVEDADALRRILDRRYAAVVANPPYITPKDSALNAAYRDRYATCYRAYALSVPFMERLFDLAEYSYGKGPAGFVGQITASSFMKREFGKRLVEDFLITRDLTHVIDTSGAYIPGHGTPTVILLARARAPVGDTVRGVLGIRGEPSTPPDPARGKVWSEITDLVDRVDAEGEFVSVEGLGRGTLTSHPWSLQGGGALEVLEAVERRRVFHLAHVASEVGRTTHTGEDDVFYVDPSAAATLGIESDCVPMVEGDRVRDYLIDPATVSAFPYTKRGEPRIDLVEATWRHLWTYRTPLRQRQDYGQRIEDRGLRWFEHSMFFPRRYRTPHSIAFAFVATHNHFVLDRGGKVFNRSAPVIKLPDRASEDDHLALLGPLNSSTGCFWMKQVFFNKGSTVDQRGARQTTVPFEDFWECDGTKLLRFPLPPDGTLDLARALDSASQELSATLPAAVLDGEPPTRERLVAARAEWEQLRRRMIALQEELDWRCYRLYGLIDEDLTIPLEHVPEVKLGERAFEIVLARKQKAGEVETRWFERHGSTPITEIPQRWPSDYRELVAQRIEAIEQLKAIRLIERPEYKRRWQTEGWEAMERAALRSFCLDRLESSAAWSEPRLQTATQLADRLLGDEDLTRALALYAGEDADPERVVAELLAEESVPYFAALRYTEPGMRKRALWERTWELQRIEDAIDRLTELPEDDPRHLTPERAERRKAQEVGEIPVPPRYVQGDFRSGTAWRHRGKLDVPKERFTSYPSAAADGGTLYGWAGWDQAERAQALAGRIVEAHEREGAGEEELLPLLAGLLELLPWLRQWHSQRDPRYGMPLSDFYDAFLDDRVRAIGATLEELRGWRPAASGRGRRRAAA